MTGGQGAAAAGGAQAPPVLELIGVSKFFGSLIANDSVSLSVGRGEVLALLGENGAGKSTLVSMIHGRYRPDEGEIRVAGRRLPPGDTRAALAAGIGMVHQHFELADNLSVLDNVMVGLEPLWRPRSARGRIRRRLLACADQFGLAVDPDARTGDLSVGEQQRVEILKALVRGARLLILDEPTAVLTPQESESLFATLSAMVATGLSMIFISHKLKEVMRVSDRIAVLRAGRLVTVVRRDQTDADQLAVAMIGSEKAAGLSRAADAAGAREPVAAGAGLGPVLALQDVHCVPAQGAGLIGCELAIAPGEIVGIAGVAGNGQQVLVDLVTGRRAPDGGEIRVAGRPIAARERAWIDAGVARIPADRLALGVIGDLDLEDNAVIEQLGDPALCRGGRVGRLIGWLDRRRIRQRAQTIAGRYDVRHAGLGRPIRQLSGGNIQKFVLGRELIRQPRLIIADQPTWGLDIGAVDFIHQQLLHARGRGAGILLISEELEEVLGLADRVAVICQGRLTPARPVRDWDVTSIGLAMAGQS